MVTRIIVELARHLSDEEPAALFMELMPPDRQEFGEHRLDSIWRDTVLVALRRMYPTAAVGVSLDWRARTTVSVTRRAGGGHEVHDPLLSAMLGGSVQDIWTDLLARHT
jgi:hypothetical protein